MPTREELRARLAGPLRRELAAGCRDDVVFGGVEKLVERTGFPFPRVAEILSGYRGLDPGTRRDRVLAALDLLEASAPRPAATAPPADARPVESRIALATPLAHAGLGRGVATRLARLDLKTVGDLVYHLPRRYEDRRALPSFDRVGENEKVTVSGLIAGRQAIKSRRGMSVLRARLEDERGNALVAVWFNQPWLEKQLFPGRRVIATGKARRRGRQLELAVAYHELLQKDEEPLAAGRIVAIYPATEGVAQTTIRRAVQRTLAELDPLADPLPAAVKRSRRLADLDRALRTAHEPGDEATLARAALRLKFDEFFWLELRLLTRAAERRRSGRPTPIPPLALGEFAASLPFDFTAAQRRAADEILADIASPSQMARLLQGDVGSGKTAVAALALHVVARAGGQGAIMAPTEVLARQHYSNLGRYLFPLGITVDLLSGSLPGRARETARGRIRSGETQVVVGTHALIQSGVDFRDLRLAIIDEEHRFGVVQRRKLAGSGVDVLVMSATPIPRSLALTQYGDLDLSVIDELPPGRTPIRTRLVTQRGRRGAYRFVRDQVEQGGQAFVVTPLIDESEALASVQAVNRLAGELADLLPGIRLAAMHGRMAMEESEGLMERFRAGRLDVLVATTVVEVGVDVPGATVMVIENAERFGLAQLHQLRGRVGRGDRPGWCVLIAGEASGQTMARLRVIEGSTDGFAIAQKDLELRGPGDLSGTQQAGFPGLVIGDLALDLEVIERAREAAADLLKQDPELTFHPEARAELVARATALGLAL